MEKHKCSKCKRIAVWYYAPWSAGKNEHDSYFCEDHVARGCSCNIIDYGDSNASVQYKDEKGRLLPCCEYDFNEKGFELTNSFS